MLVDIRSLDPVRVAGLLLAGLIVQKIARVIYTAYFTPLNQVPGPKWARLTDLWLLWQLYSFRKCPTINECFHEYGPIVRIGPNKVALNTEEAIKTIYGIGTKFVKSEWYKTWSLLGFDNVFTIHDPKEHAERRRITAKLMSKSNVVVYLPDINDHIGNFIRLCSRRSGKVINLMPIYRYLALDVVGSTAFGRSFDLMKTGADHPFADDLDACVMAIPPRGYVSKWAWEIIKRFPNEKWQFYLGGEERMCSYSDEVIDEQLAYAKGHDGQLSEKHLKTLVGAYLGYKDPKGRPLSRGVITGEIGTIYFAGTDTTSNSLAFITWEVARSKAIQGKLFGELRERISDPSQVPTLADVETWPYLNAVIKEGLRKYAAAPSHLERVVPPGGATIQGKYLPAGTVVGVQAYSIHRKPEVFPDPEAFIPERWLDETEEMRRHFMPFGLGSRVCMGMHIAYIEMRLALAMLVRNFAVSLPEGHDPRDMECKDFWLVFPAAKKLEVTLTPRNQAECLSP
ncbi:hypothetical protein H2204_014203 [Knufia peltigerae]|uniref:Cytochrome P450 n=1 Tax=Knufia peltigerae TaxID=1002370 RepID=A0AA38XM17_9EURO|nr:hypothetical protein H2204_014203 [Knufia peltigerae]